jgi:hypothetical protein
VLQQHDQDQRGGLPEEDLSRQAQHDRQRVDVGGDDGEADQRHHARLATLQLTGKPGQERPAAVEEHRAGEQRLDDADAWETDYARQADQHLDVLRQQHDADRQRQADPEAAAEVRDHRAVVMSGLAVAGPRGPRLGCGCGCIMPVMVRMACLVVHVGDSWRLVGPHHRQCEVAGPAPGPPSRGNQPGIRVL